jgi:hypothetical protein
VLFLFFLLVSGDIFLHRLVEILPRFSGKRQVVEISQQIESDISAYLATITLMNAGVGIATALAMWLTGVGDPILWGTVAFLLNYVPILGPALGVSIFLLAGLLPSRPREFRPEPLTEPDLILSHHPARAIARRLPPSAELSGSSWFDPVGPRSTAMTCPLCSTGITPASSLLQGSPPLSGASVLSASRLEPLAPFPLASPARFSRSIPEPD